MGWFDSRDEVKEHYEQRKKTAEREAAQKQSERDAVQAPAVALVGEMKSIEDTRMSRHRHAYREGVWAEANHGVTPASRSNCAAAMQALGISTDVFLSDIQEQRNAELTEKQLGNYDAKIKQLQANRAAAKSELDLAEQKLAEAKAAYRDAYNGERTLESTRIFYEAAKAKNRRLWW